jgi:hypothetical protein
VRARLSELVAQVLQWTGVRHRITKGRGGHARFAGRIGFLRAGETEAFASLGHTGELLLRLDRDTDLSRFPAAKKRQVENRRFGVHIYVRSEQALDQAMALLTDAHAVAPESSGD